VAGRTGKKGGDEALVRALAAGLSVPKAAAAAGLSERTAYRRLENPAFRSRVDRARQEVVDGVVGKLSALGDTSVEALDGLLKSPTENIKLGATRTALEYLFKSHEQLTLARQMDELRRELEELKRHDGGDAETAGGEAAGGSPPPGPGGEPPPAPGGPGERQGPGGLPDGPGPLCS
jgi:hypothetical protein